MISLDRLIIGFDQALRTIAAPATATRAMPGEEMPEGVLSEVDRRRAGALMRVNHAGEVCAQALYQGQALTSRAASVRGELERAAYEETEHLAWTERRIADLGSHKSRFNLFWYGGSVTLGILAGCLGDRWSLGFLAETERQVGAHLESHLRVWPAEDVKSRAVLLQMQRDELSHAEMATRLGGAELPHWVCRAMKLASGVMVRVAYRW